MNTRSFAIFSGLGLSLFLSCLSGPHASPTTQAAANGQDASPAEPRASLHQFVSSKNSRVLFQQASDIPMIDLAIEIDAGNRWDPQGLEGLASLTAQLAKAGVRSSANRPALGETEMGEAWADLAVEQSVGTSRDQVSMRFRFLSDPKVRDAAIALIARVLAEPAMADSVFERQRATSIAGLKESLSRPQTLATRALWQAMYQGHPYGALVTEGSLQATSRDHLVAFHGFYWSPERMSIAIVGDIGLAEAKRLVESTQALLQSGISEKDQTLAALTGFRSSLGPAPQGGPSGSTIKVDHPASQAHIWMGLPVLARHELDDYFALTLANHILGGGGFVSRLTKEIREKRGMAYSVFSAVQPLAQTGPFFLGLQTQREQASQAVKVVNETLNNFIAQGPSEEELVAAKKNLIGGFALRLDSNRKLIDNLAAINFYRLPANYLDTWTDRIDMVSREDVQNVLNQRLAGRGMVTVIVAGKPGS